MTKPHMSAALKGCTPGSRERTAAHCPAVALVPQEGRDWGTLAKKAPQLKALVRAKAKEKAKAKAEVRVEAEVREGVRVALAVAVAAPVQVRQILGSVRLALHC